MLKPTPLFGTSVEGISKTVSAQSRVNFYVEPTPDSGVSPFALYPLPGTMLFVDLGEAPCRAAYAIDDSLYVVQGSNFFEINNAGIATLRGTLMTLSGRCWIANNLVNELCIVDGPFGYIYNTLTNTFTQITDPDFPGGETVGYIDGRFLVKKPNSGQFYGSAVNNGASWAALDFATAEAAPDKLVALWVDRAQVVLFGTDTTEFWASSSDTFPFARVGSSAVQWGLAARDSVARFDNSLIFLRRSSLGQVQVAILTGYDSVAVSSPDLDHALNGYTTDNAVGYSFMLFGHPMYVISFPSDNVSWLFDGLTKVWSQYSSADGRHLGEIQVNFLDKAYVTSYADGKIYRLEHDVYTDNGTPIKRLIRTKHVLSLGKAVSALWVDMEPGVGTTSGQGSDPEIMLRVSRDGGYTWGNEFRARVGKLGEYNQRAMFRKLGRVRSGRHDWVFEISISDPVKAAIRGAWMDVNG